MTAEQQRRVLVVDDDATIRELLCTVLRDRGLSVDEAGDGKEALDRIDSRPYGVIVIDLLMPLLDGFTVIEALKALTPRPVVLVVTAAERSAIDGLDPAIVHGIIRKPFDHEEVANVVAACAEIRARMPLETMALAMAAGGSLWALLNRLI